MKVFYDGAIYSTQRQGGIPRYHQELFRHLPAEIETVVGRPRKNCPPREWLHGAALYPATSWKLPRFVFRWWQRHAIQQLFRRWQPDLWHPTYFCLESGWNWNEIRVPVVLTIHDMIHELFPKEMDPEGTNRKCKQAAILRADAIITNSQSTTRDLLRFYPQIRDRIVSIFLAGSFDGIEPSAPERADSRPAFLYVGARSSYKNFKCLLDGFERIVKRFPDTQLWVVGSPLKAHERQQLSARELSEKVVEWGHVDDKRLARLYRQCTALVYPSRYEGFGIPLLEAMQCGAPVICSNSSSLPEVVGSAALLFDPHETDALAAHLVAVLESSALREDLRSRGFEQARNFSWERTAAETARVYRDVCPKAEGPQGDLLEVSSGKDPAAL